MKIGVQDHKLAAAVLHFARFWRTVSYRFFQPYHILYPFSIVHRVLLVSHKSISVIGDSLQVTVEISSSCAYANTIKSINTIMLRFRQKIKKCKNSF